MCSASSTDALGETVVILLPLRRSTSATFLFIRQCFGERLGEQSFKVNYNNWQGKTSLGGHFNGPGAEFIGPLTEIYDGNQEFAGIRESINLHALFGKMPEWLN